MGTRGRPRKPNAQKKMEGTYRQDRDIGEAEPETLDRVPNAPKVLSSKGKDEWRVTANQLFSLGILTPGDLSFIAIMCNEVDRYWLLDVQIKKMEETVFLEPDLPPEPEEPDYFNLDPQMVEEVSVVYQAQYASWARKCQLLQGAKDRELRKYQKTVQLQAISSQKARELAIQFGFTPSSRSGIKVPPKPQKSQLDTLMDGV